MNVEIHGHEICHVKTVLILLTIPGTTPISDTTPQMHTFIKTW